MFVSRLADQVSLAPGWSVPCETMVALGAALSRGLDEAGAGCDAARLLWTLATELERRAHDSRGLDIDEVVGAAMAGAASSSSPSTLGSLTPVVESLSTALKRRIDQDGSWRAESDLARRAPRWMRAALTTAARTGWRREVTQPAAERFYLRAILHGHLWLTGDDGPVCESFKRRALRLLIAREILQAPSEAERAAEPALSYPLALVEAVSRGLEQAPADCVSMSPRR